MKLSQFKFKLPENQIALYPHSIYREFENDKGEKETFRITRRDECRLMVLHKKSQTIDMFKKDADGKPIEGESMIPRCSRLVFMAQRRRPMPRLRCSFCVSLMRRCAFGMCLLSQHVRYV